MATSGEFRWPSTGRISWPQSPALSTPVGIAPEVIEPPQTGFLISSSEPDALAAGLRAVLEQRSRWSEIGAAARQRVERLTAEAMAKRYVELYVDWLEAHASNATHHTSANVSLK